jgi:hypothetical protein
MPIHHAKFHAFIRKWTIFSLCHRIKTDISTTQDSNTTQRPLPKNIAARNGISKILEVLSPESKSSQMPRKRESPNNLKARALSEVSDSLLFIWLSNEQQEIQKIINCKCQIKRKPGESNQRRRPPDVYIHNKLCALTTQPQQPKAIESIITSVYISFFVWTMWRKRKSILSSTNSPHPKQSILGINSPLPLDRAPWHYCL